MSENPISITTLNDFIFCPASIYFHMIDSDEEKLMQQGEAQLNGSASHEHSDNGTYSTSTDILQGISVYCSQYGLQGKIDIFDKKNGILTERKRTIKTIYDGYVYQLYAQYYSLLEMGYSVKQLRLYSMTDNKSYEIKLPEEDERMSEKFNSLLSEISNFRLEGYEQNNTEKCANCIYSVLCSFSAE